MYSLSRHKMRLISWLLQATVFTFVTFQYAAQFLTVQTPVFTLNMSLSFWLLQSIVFEPNRQLSSWLSQTAVLEFEAFDMQLSCWPSQTTVFNLMTFRSFQVVWWLSVNVQVSFWLSGSCIQAQHVAQLLSVAENCIQAHEFQHSAQFLTIRQLYWFY